MRRMGFREGEGVFGSCMLPSVKVLQPAAAPGTFSVGAGRLRQARREVHAVAPWLAEKGRDGAMEPPALMISVSGLELRQPLLLWAFRDPLQKVLPHSDETPGFPSPGTSAHHKHWDLWTGVVKQQHEPMPSLTEPLKCPNIG